MKKIMALLASALLMFQFSMAQLTTLPNGGNKKAMVSELVGLTDVTIHYNRPHVKGREGKIWGQLVPFGYNDLGFGTAKAAPWRAGANESTTIEFSTDVMINGKKLTAGKYGFFIAVGKDESTIIFSKNTTGWGSYYYDEAADALRVTTKQQELDKSVEFLQFVFLDQTTNAATIALQWEKWSFPFKVETDVNKAQVAIFKNELAGMKGFDWQPWAQAANWTVDNNSDLEQGLVWADYGIDGPFVGQKNFTTLSAKARVLDKMGKADEAAALMKEAAGMGTMDEVHGYARQLAAEKKYKEAAEAFKANYKKYPNTFTTNMGMVRALSSEGKYKEALKYANAALAQAPDSNNKSSVTDMIEKLKAGKDMN